MKCVNCGFLALRNLETRALDETEQLFREKGRATTVLDAKGRAPLGWEVHPVCFMMAANLSQEIKKDERGGPARIVEVINAERECEAYLPWRQGFTPKEHREFVDQRDERMRRLVEKQSEDRQRKLEKESDKRWRLMELVVSAAVSFVTTALAIIAGRYWLGD